MKQLYLRIYGRVQGVYYRASACHEARRCNLKGWVRNCSDGSVELLAEGSENDLGTLLHWCHQGPPGARVEHIESTWNEAEAHYPSFEVRYS